MSHSGRVLDSYPLSGVVPFRGLAQYAAPLCYLHGQPAALYRLFKALYCRYFCKLHCLTTPATGAGHAAVRLATLNSHFCLHY